MARHKQTNDWQMPDLNGVEYETYSTWGIEDWLANGYDGNPLVSRQYKQENKMGIPIPSEFLHKFPDLPIHKAQEKWQKYLYEMRKVLLKRLPYMKDDKTTLSTKKLRDDCGRFYPHGKKGDRYTKEETKYVYNEFYPLYPFYGVVTPGNNISGKNTEIVIVNQKLIDLLIDSADHSELVSIYFGDMTIELLDELTWVNIDMKSLSNYIKSTQHQLQNTDQDKQKTYYYKLLRSLRQAKYIKMMTEFFDCGKFPMREKKSPYGRTYYEGLNLQNCTKEVRNAALGDNHQYDIEAAVYAIKLLLVEDVYNEKKQDFIGKYTYTKEYLEQKNNIRHRLAQHIQAYPDGLKLVKEALTAIGFGAKISGGAWLEGTDMQYPAINDIIMNPDDRKRFMNDPWVIEFYKEQRHMTTEITDFYKNYKGWCDKHLSNLPRSKNKLGKYRKTAIISYLFQNLETMIMNEITKDLDKDNILLVIHDCIITERPINGIDLQDIRHKLISISRFLKISNEYNKGWLDIDTMSYEFKHKQFIQEQEQQARSYHSLFITTDNIPVKKRKYNDVFIQSDRTYYDGYDDGSQYNEYDIERDDTENMTLEERNEHYRIIGYDTNKLPDFINKLLGDNK